MHHLLVRWIICWCDLNKITYGLDDDEGYSITCIICWCERSMICWCDLNQGPRSHSKCLSARISERFLSSVSALKSWRQEKYNDGMKGQCNSHLATTWSSAQEDMVSFPVVFTTMPKLDGLIEAVLYSRQDGLGKVKNRNPMSLLFGFPTVSFLTS